MQEKTNTEKKVFAENCAKSIMGIYGMFIKGPMKEQREEYKKMFMEDLVKLALGEEISPENEDTYRKKREGMCYAAGYENDFELLGHLAKEIKEMLKIIEQPLEEQIKKLMSELLKNKLVCERLVRIVERLNRCR